MRKAIFIFVAVIAFLVINSYIPTKEECDIYNSTVRLHVIANSDSDEDQSLKLKVRDKIIERMSTYNAKSKEEALSYIENDMENLKKIAEECIINEGFNNSVSIELGEENYPTREYEDFSLPAGKYTSLRIIIGEGSGQNWWCVLYPPLCTSYAIEYDDDSIDVGFTKEQYDFITGYDKEYKVKFKLLEMASQAFGFEY